MPSQAAKLLRVFRSSRTRRQRRLVLRNRRREGKKRQHAINGDWSVLAKAVKRGDRPLHNKNKKKCSSVPGVVMLQKQMAEILGREWPLPCIIISSLLAILLVAKCCHDKTKKNSYSKLPPGTRGWPIVGDSISWCRAVATPHPPQFVEQQAKQFGNIFTCSLFGKRAIVSVDPAFNRFVMQNEGKLFQSSYPKSFKDLVGKNGVITAQGEQQRKLHSIASNMMRMDKLKSHFLQDIQVVIKQIMGNLGDDQVVSLQDVCRKVAINLMVNQLLGASSEAQVNEMARLFSDFTDGCLSVPIKLPGFAYHKAMQARESIISKINRSMEIHRHKSYHESVGQGVLGRLLEEESLPDDAVVDFIINLLFAGNETTAKTMLFAVYFLTQCPRALNQLLDEQQSFKSGSGEMLSWQDYKAMDFTQCVIDETLRLGGIAIWLMREAKVEVEYQAYIIPKRSFVVPFLSAVHLNENVYEDSLHFNPWRWMEPENQDKRNWRSSSYFAPFGGGGRLCPGAELARLQIALFLHYFLTMFRWKQMKQDQMSFFPSARLVNGFQVQMTKTSSNGSLPDFTLLCDAALTNRIDVEKTKDMHAWKKCNFVSRIRHACPKNCKLSLVWTLVSRRGKQWLTKTTTNKDTSSLTSQSLLHILLSPRKIPTT